MSLIFILTGAIVVFFDMRTGVRAWLIALPFSGHLDRHCFDVAQGVYLPRLFLAAHTGGGLFGAIFVFILFRGIYEMWGAAPPSSSKT
jgi:hypothetical protein